MSLVQRLRYIHHSQATVISYTFLVADYQSSTVTLSFKLLCLINEDAMWASQLLVSLHWLASKLNECLCLQSRFGYGEMSEIKRSNGSEADTWI